MSLAERIDQSGLPDGLKTALKQNLAPAVRMAAAARERPATEGGGDEPRTAEGDAFGGRAPVARSRLGGLPNLPLGCTWPDPALSFIAQIDLKEAAAHAPEGSLPPHGRLLVFYDAVAQPWGAPDQAEGWRVMYVADGDTDLAPVPAPEGVPVFRVLPLTFASDLTLPTPDLLGLGAAGGPQEAAPGLGPVADWDFQTDAWSLDEGPCHQLLGHPYPIQGDPLREAAQYSGAGEWRLLLQVDSDQRAGMMWGDAGMLYFCIRPEDLAARRFDRVWCIMQCS
jgi:hypothetical protein